MAEIMNLAAMPEDEITLVFLQRVLPPDGRGWYVMGSQKNRTNFRHTYFSTIVELRDALLQWDEQGYDVWFGLGTSDNNTTRKVENIVELKDFWLDIEFGAIGHATPSPYQNADEAAIAVAAFCSRLGIPYPMLLESGHGLHVHWPLDEPVATDVWLRYAHGLKRLCAAYGLHADPSKTSTATAILRPHGTHNYKVRNDIKRTRINYMQHTPVAPLSRFNAFVEAKTSNVVPLRPATLQTQIGQLPDFLQARDAVPVKVVVEDDRPSYGIIAIERCLQLQHFRDSKGNVSEPEWQAYAGILAYCVDGDNLMHEWSSGYPSYTRAETQRKLDRVRAETTGPRTCVNLSTLNRICASCPQNGLCSTPVHLGHSAFDPYAPPAVVSGRVVAETQIAQFELTAGGAIKPKSYINTCVSLKLLGVRARYDTFRYRYLVRAECVGPDEMEMTDAAVRAMRDRIITSHNHDPGKDHVYEALYRLCEANAFNPVEDFLMSLQWDGVERLDNWQHTYLQAEDTPLNRAFGRKTLLAAVRRGLYPKIKFDHMLVWESEQGRGKSTAVRILAGDEYFSEQRILHADTKTQQELVQGVWLYEVSELAGLRRTESDMVRQFLSRLSDDARPAYGRCREDRPRRCVFIGTTNNEQYLTDETGNRRFWPVKVGWIDLKALARDRDQLWAEAVHYVKKGETHELDPKLYAAASRVQASRMIGDDWEDFLCNIEGEIFDEGNGKHERISTIKLMALHLRLDPSKLNGATVGRRLRRIMTHMGWEGPTRMRFDDGESKMGFIRPRT